VATTRWVSEPARHIKWIAEHRVAVRVLLLVVDVAVVTLVVVTTLDHTARWSTYLIMLTYAGLTWQFGWAIPATVKKWQTQNDSGAEGSS